MGYQSAPKSGTPQGSFLLDDKESLSDSSTKIADQSGDDRLGVRSGFFDDAVDDDDALPLPLPSQAPPTPPSTVGAPSDSADERFSNRPEPLLDTNDSTGIDIVVARFHLVVKWVVSEMMLTDAPSERARCITKFIHIATDCHRLRNYAPIYQITLASLSADSRDCIRHIY
ncbi:Uu.00g107660.m01.CDS01 [Anthostomella pinea]|uniref:Uu.00g107660.m01.CDS01 n=1 Tax=Anthostomella pinea TaxID=933095 RepID=A0AAI8YG01_9PEZI|nr:Uu.00g107660.m01.CDS01 [Anthostomella pinea]